MPRPRQSVLCNRFALVLDIVLFHCRRLCDMVRSIFTVAHVRRHSNSFRVSSDVIPVPFFREPKQVLPSLPISSCKTDEGCLTDNIIVTHSHTSMLRRYVEVLVIPFTLPMCNTKY
uniref:Uncharacterized protein n=1 Tax=Sipha flava TaxID=143950 RepID=A0A2S2Q050_9HEMI